MSAEIGFLNTIKNWMKTYLDTKISTVNTNVLTANQNANDSRVYANATLTAVGDVGNTANANGSIHAKLSAIYPLANGANSNSNNVNINVGSNADVASSTGSVHAKLKDLKNTVSGDDSAIYNRLNCGKLGQVTLLVACPVNIGAGSSSYWDGGDLIYVFTGFTTGRFYKYSISGNTWTQIATPTLVANSPNSTLCIHPYNNDKMYFAQYGNTVAYVYTISTNTWVATATVFNTNAMISPRFVPVNNNALIYLIDVGLSTPCYTAISSSTGGLSVTNYTMSLPLSGNSIRGAMVFNCEDVICIIGYMDSATAGVDRAFMQTYGINNNGQLIINVNTLIDSASADTYGTVLYSPNTQQGKYFAYNGYWLYFIDGTDSRPGNILKLKVKLPITNTRPTNTIDTGHDIDFSLEIAGSMGQYFGPTNPYRLGACLTFVNSLDLYTLYGGDSTFFAKHSLVAYDTNMTHKQFFQ
jgi:hypothetical protein